MGIQLVGIAGGTCSGKTTLLKSLQSRFQDKISAFSFDEYFVGSDKYNVDDITNFEDPKLFDFLRFISDLQKLKNGNSLEIRANSRESSQSGVDKKVIVSRPLIVVEGFLIFYIAEARSFFDKKIFIELPDDEIIKRRFARTKGTKHWDSHAYIQNKLIPYHQKYVEPQKKYVDLVIDGMQPIDKISDQVIEFITN
jgi:uridine kinase